MHYVSISNLFDAGLIVRSIIVQQKFYAMTPRQQAATLVQLHSALSEKFLPVNEMTEEQLNSCTTVTSFLRMYAETCRMCDYVDASSWAFTVFFIASPVMCIESIRKGWFVGAPFMPAFHDCRNGWITTNTALQLWYFHFETYLWEAVNTEFIAEVIKGNSGMMAVFQSVCGRIAEIPSEEMRETES